MSNTELFDPTKGQPVVVGEVTYFVRGLSAREKARVIAKAKDIDEVRFEIGADTMEEVISYCLLGWDDKKVEFKYRDDAMLDYLNDEAYFEVGRKAWDLSGFNAEEKGN